MLLSLLVNKKTEQEKLTENLQSAEALLDNKRLEVGKASLKAKNVEANLKICAPEECLRVNEALTRTLGAKWALENALRSACETELRLRFRLYQATDDVMKLAAETPEIGAILGGTKERIGFSRSILVLWKKSSHSDGSNSCC